MSCYTNKCECNNSKSVPFLSNALLKEMVFKEMSFQFYNFEEGITYKNRVDKKVEAFAKFIEGGPDEIIEREIAGQINTLDYHLRYLNAIDKLVTQDNGVVTVNGHTRKTMAQIEIDATDSIYDLGEEFRATNKESIETAIGQIGFVTIDSFELGATLTQRNQALRHGADGKLYRWAGDLPKLVPTSSTPTSTGGFGANAWLEVSDTALRQEILTGGLLTDTIVTTTVNGAGSVARTQRDINAESISIKDFIKTTDTDRAIAIRAAQLVSDEVLIPYGTYNIDSNLSVTARLVFQKGARLQIAEGVVVTFTTGEVSSGHNQVFTGDGEVRGLRVGVPEWFGAKGGGVIDDTVAVQKSVNSSKTHSLNLSSLYGISNPIVISKNNANICGMTSSMSSGFICLSADACLQLGNNAGDYIYQINLENFVVNGRRLANRLIYVKSAGETNYNHLGLNLAAVNGIGIELASLIAGISPFYNIHTNGVDRPIYFNKFGGTSWFYGCNFYDSDSVFSAAPSTTMSNVVANTCWFESWNNICLFDSTNGDIDVLGFAFNDCNFLNTYGGQNKDARILKVISSNESYRSRIQQFKISGGRTYTTATKYFIEVLWNKTYAGGLNRFTGSIDGLVSGSSSAGNLPEAFFNSDVSSSQEVMFIDFKIGRNNNVTGSTAIKPSTKPFAYNRDVLEVNSVTPDVRKQSDLYRTMNTQPTVITNLLNGVVGNTIYIAVGDNFTTFKFALGTSNLRGNNGVDYVAQSNDLIQAIYSGNLWHCTIIK